MNVPLLSLRDLRVDLGSFVLAVPAFDLCAGQVMAVIGPNGAGKSTLLRALACLEPRASGVVTFHGVAVARSRATAYRRRLSMLFQEPLLLDTSVYENVAAPLRLRGARGKPLDGAVRHWLERLDVAALAGRQARTLSGGEARRVSLARAFVTEPELLLLDEPFVSLDAPTRNSFLIDLARLLPEQRVTAVVVTHDLAETRLLADTVAVILGGRLAETLPADALLTSAQQSEVRSFLASMRSPLRVGPPDDDRGNDRASLPMP